MKPITAIILGAGQRGANVYGGYALNFPNELKIVGVAEPRADRRAAFAKEHGIPEGRCFAGWEDALRQDKFADCVFVCTQDRMHFEPVMQALEKGYDVLCEKPMSYDRTELIAMGEKARQTGRVLSICHVLRYSPFFVKLKELIDSGTIGQLVSIQHIESVGYWHMAHSFVRGNWSRSEDSCPMILAKCCHDTDILTWLVGSPCREVSSFGSLAHFNSAHKPDGAPQYCLDGCMHRDTCPYYAPRFYLEHPKAISDGFVSVVSLDPSHEAVLHALQRGPYGRCVYQCDNDVVDNQVVNLLYENGVSVSMTMCAFTEHCERIINVMGSRGQIRGNMESSTLEISDFATGNHTTLHVHTPSGGHSGSDAAMMREFLQTLRSGRGSKTSADASVESHLIALAAEESRLQNGTAIHTVIHYHANLMSALKYATEMELISVNPMGKVKRPKLIQNTANFYTLEEAEHLISAVHGDPIEFPVIMAAYYGLRRSEIVGLRWKAIDFESDRITIDHTVIQVKVDGELKIIAKDRAKNKASCRSLPLMPQIKEMLLQMKNEQEENRRLCGNCYHDSEYVYVNKLGTPYTPNYITDHFRNFLKKNEFRKLTFHGLRHSCASMLLKQSVGMKDIQAWLGHSTYNTTANFYAHLDTASKTLVGEAMESMLTVPLSTPMDGLPGQSSIHRWQAAL